MHTIDHRKLVLAVVLDKLLRTKITFEVSLAA